jgi:2-C-methyl-D-erythritol 2,4-cyclodiphosphate synthase
MDRLRIGTGFDIHRLVVGRRLVLGGVALPWELGLLGNSDADVMCHALIDALCGAADLGSIGELFPDTDSRYRDARSLDLLKETCGRIRAGGFAVESADVTLLAQAPRLLPYRREIRSNLSEAMQVDEKAMGVKATTTDRLGLIGQGEAMAAQAVVLLRSTT